MAEAEKAKKEAGNTESNKPKVQTPEGS